MHDQFTIGGASAQVEVRENAPARCLGGMPLDILRGGLSAVELSIIVAVYAIARGRRFCSVTQSELAAATGIERANCGRALRRMLARGDLDGIIDRVGSQFELLQVACLEVTAMTSVSNCKAETHEVTAMTSVTSVENRVEVTAMTSTLQDRVEAVEVTAMTSRQASEGGLTDVVPSSPLSLDSSYSVSSKESVECVKTSSLAYARDDEPSEKNATVSQAYEEPALIVVQAGKPRRVPRNPWTRDERRVLAAMRTMNGRLHPGLVLPDAKWEKRTLAAARAILREHPVAAVLTLIGRLEMLARRQPWWLKKATDLRYLHTKWLEIEIEAPPANVVDFPLGDRVGDALRRVSEVTTADEMGALMQSLKHLKPGSGLPV